VGKAAPAIEKPIKTCHEGMPPVALFENSRLNIHRTNSADEARMRSQPLNDVTQREVLDRGTCCRFAVCRALAVLSVLSNLASTAPLAAGDRAAPKRAPLAPNAAKGFDFETEQIAGTIQLEGAYHGVTKLVDKRSGRQVIDPRYSALNLFKLLSVNAFMGEPRSMPRMIEAAGEWVEVKWPATEMYKGEITARYEVLEPAAVNLTIRVHSLGTYAAHELFLSSYFDKALKPHVFLQPVRGAATREPEIVVPQVNDLFRGTLPVFPRDAHAARRCIDGRWDRNEFGTPTVQMCPLRRYGHCLAFMADSTKQLGVVLMSRPRDCYAISSRYHAENDADRLTNYSAFDLSLFGDDLLPGDEQSVTVRLALTSLDNDLSQPLKLYEEFLAETGPTRSPPDTKGAQP
jgi:hypothetical protein